MMRENGTCFCLCSHYIIAAMCLYRCTRVYHRVSHIQLFLLLTMPPENSIKISISSAQNIQKRYCHVLTSTCLCFYLFEYHFAFMVMRITTVQKKKTSEIAILLYLLLIYFSFNRQSQTKECLIYCQPCTYFLKIKNFLFQV